MSYLFYINDLDKVVLHPEVVKLCESFRALNDKEICFVVLYADYNSIYRQFPEHERKRRASFHAFDDNEEDLINSHRIQTAIKDYVSLQYNRKVEVSRIYEQKIDKYLREIETEDNPKVVIEKMNTIKSLRTAISELDKEVEASTKVKGVIKGKMELSHLEELMSNMKNHKSITSQAPKLK